MGVRFLLLMGVLSSVVIRAESLGNLRIEDLTLRPNASLSEPQTGSFSLGESSASLGYDFDHFLSARFRVGTHALLARPGFYPSEKDADELDLIEAFAQVDGMLGQIQVGLIPLELDVDAQKKDGQLIFPRGLLYSKRLFGLRDIGAKYSVGYNHFFTSVAVHNGEGKADEDNRTWYSATWGYDFYKLRVAAFGLTGSTKPLSTTGSTLTVASFDPNKDSKWRMGGVFAHWVPSQFEMNMQFALGDREQELEQRRFISGLLDFGQMGEKGFGAYFRYGLFDPDQNVKNDGEHNLSVALVWANKLKTSKLILIGTKILEEKDQIQNDEIQLTWSLTPQISF